MLKTIVTINSERGAGEFNRIFANTASKENIEVKSILSKDCLFAINYPDTSFKTTVIYKNQPLQTESTGFFIKSYKDDSYNTFLLAQVLQNVAVLYSDNSNLQHSNSADKVSITTLFPLHGIPVPKSIICTPHSYLQNKQWVEGQLSFPCVIKKPGSKGKQVWKVKDHHELLEKLSIDDQHAIIQEYLPNDHDFRVFVQDGKIIAVIKRNTADGFYNNVSQGGKAEVAEITKEEADVCILAAKLSGLKVAGVDFVRHNGNPYIFEVNKNPQIVLFDNAVGTNITEEITSNIVAKLLSQNNQQLQ